MKVCPVRTALTLSLDLSKTASQLFGLNRDFEASSEEFPQFSSVLVGLPSMSEGAMAPDTRFPLLASVAVTSSLPAYESGEPMVVRA